MKKVLLAGFLLFLTPLVWAGESAAPDTASPWYVGLGGTLDFGTSNWFSDFNSGIGPSELVGVHLGGPWALQANLDQLFYSGGLYNFSGYRGLVLLKYTYVDHGLQHYLLAGPGLIYQTLNPTNQSTVNFDMTFGLGFQLNLSRGLDAYLEAKYNGIFSSSLSFGDIPITAGILLDI